jgi:hypothetical protein
MSGLTHDEAENRVLNILFEATSVENYYLGIYTAPTIALAEAEVMTDLTEPSGNGYARQVLTRATDWTVIADEAVAAQKTFTASGGAWGNCYGYFITTELTGTAGKLMWSELFSDGPYNIVDSGNIKVSCKCKCA